MGEATKYLLGQGILGIVVVALGIAVVHLWRVNRVLSDRLETKSDKHAEKNQALAEQVVAAFKAATQATGKRRNTKAIE